MAYPAILKASVKSGSTIYLDYQAATPLDPEVSKRMSEAETRLFANPQGGEHALAWKAAVAIEEARTSVAELVSETPENIIFTHSATHSNRIVLDALTTSKPAQDTTIIVGEGDHSSIIDRARSLNIKVKIWPLDNCGRPNPDWILRQNLCDVDLVSVIGVSNETGVLTNLSSIGSFCREQETWLHVDASQMPLACDIVAAELQASFLTLSSQKIYGPKGIGALYVEPGLELSLGLDGRDALLGTPPTSLIIGFGVASALVLEKGYAERHRVSELRDKFVDALAKNFDAELVGDPVDRHPGNALVYLPGIDASDLLARLQPQIAASTQSACRSNPSSGTSQVIRAMGYDEDFAHSCIRFSVGRFTDRSQIESALKDITELITYLSSKDDR